MSEEFSTNQSFSRIDQEVSSWPGVSKHGHSYGGTEYHFGSAQIGHIHTRATVHIPFPRAFHDELIAQGLAEKHPWSPESGWISFHPAAEDGTRHAIWLMRLSYLRYALRKAPDAITHLEHESEELHLSPSFRALLRSSCTGSSAPFGPPQSPQGEQRTGGI